MDGVVITETKDEIVLTIRKDGSYGVSKSGGNPVVATTRGFVVTPSGVRISLNAIR
jgi:hypothetical protein